MRPFFQISVFVLFDFLVSFSYLLQFLYFIIFVSPFEKNKNKYSTNFMQKSEIVYQHQHSLISFHWKFTQLMFESGLHCAYVKMSLFLSLSIWKSKGKKKKTLHTIFLIDVWNICTLSELICYFISGIFIFIYLFRCIFYHLLLHLFSFFRCGDLTLLFHYSFT